MKFLEQYRGIVVFGVLIAVLFGAIFINSNSQTADEQKKAEAAKQQQKEADTKAKSKEQSDQKATKATTYTYSARTGDSYSVLARKAIQEYAKETKVELSQAQIIAAETNLTIAAGSPGLEIQQIVTIDKQSIKNAVQAAQQLSQDEQAAWAVYAPYTNFDTSQNG